MSNSLKVISFFILSIGLTGCATINDVVQDAYNVKAQKDCYKPIGSRDSIHTGNNSLCSKGNYYPKLKTPQKFKKSD